MTLPKGDRQDVVTYTVRERAGSILFRGLQTQEIAERMADRWAQDNYGPCRVERVTHVSFTDREPVYTTETT